MLNVFSIIISTRQNPSAMNHYCCTHRSTHRLNIKHSSSTLGDQDEILLFIAKNVVITHFGHNDVEEFEPATVKIYTVKSCDKKGWMVAHNHFEMFLIFNAFVPGNISAKSYRNDKQIH